MYSVCLEYTAMSLNGSRKHCVIIMSLLVLCFYNVERFNLFKKETWGTYSSWAFFGYIENVSYPDTNLLYCIKVFNEFCV